MIYTTLQTTTYKYLFIADACMYLYIVSNDGDIPKVQCCINLVHHVEGGGLVVVQSKHLETKWKVRRNKVESED